MNNLDKVIITAWKLIDDLNSNTKTLDEIRTQAVLLNTINKSIQLGIQDEIVKNNMGYIQLKQANLLQNKLEKEDN